MVIIPFKLFKEINLYVKKANFHIFIYIRSEYNNMGIKIYMYIYSKVIQKWTIMLRSE